jgi:hypothetical protein
MTGQTFEYQEGGMKFSEGMGTYGVRRGGENWNGFFDRDGEYFRPGVDPRNYYGRFLPDNDPEPLRFGSFAGHNLGKEHTKGYGVGLDPKANWTEEERQGFLDRVRASLRDIANAS